MTRRRIAAAVFAACGVLLLLMIWMFAGEPHWLWYLWHGPQDKYLNMLRITIREGAGFYTPDLTLAQLAMKIIGLAFVGVALLTWPTRRAA